MTLPALPARTLRLRIDDTAPLQALLVAAGPHLERVVDVGSAANGDLLVELPPARAGLAALLAARERLDAGEAVTLLVPLAEALAGAHAAGTALGEPGAAAVRITEDGAPYWAAPERPVLGRWVAEEAFRSAVAADDAAFAALATAVLARAGVVVPASWRPSVESLFALAEPLPLRLDPPAEPAVLPVVAPQRLVAPVPVVPAAPRPPRSLALLGTLPERVRASLAAVRARVWAAAAGAAALLVLALVLLPGSRGDAGERPVPASSTARTSAPSRPAPVVGTVAPAAALRALLDARAQLLAAGDADGLAVVEASGSPVLVSDRAAIDAGTEPVRVGRDRVAMRSSGGGTALADVGGVTVLAVRQQNGWRLRDVVAEPPR